MARHNDWERIVARVQGIRGAVAVLDEKDYFGLANKYVIPSAVRLVTEMEQFASAHSHSLSAPALESLTSGLRQLRSLLPSAHPNAQKGLATALVGLLLAIESEVSFHLGDFDDRVAPIAERAFLHLQRSLIVDESLRKRWNDVFDSSGEVGCEKLGAVHLLLHGIYAFKTDSTGERTDLVLGEHFAISPELRRSVVAMVLTEWKVAKSANDAAAKFEEAHLQARRYSRSALAGFEVCRYRYLIVVTKGLCKVPQEIVDAGTTYRHVNIAISPATPSKQSKGA